MGGDSFSVKCNLTDCPEPGTRLTICLFILITWQLMDNGGLGLVLDPAQRIVELVSRQEQGNVTIRPRNMEGVIALENPQRKKVSLGLFYIF